MNFLILLIKFIIIGINIDISISKIIKIIIIKIKFIEILNDLNIKLLNPHSIFQNEFLYLFNLNLFLIFINNIKIINNMIINFFVNLIKFIFFF